MIQLIADSGSTKVDWRALMPDGTVKAIYTEGINPVFQTAEYIIEIFRKKLLPELGSGVTDVYFYGAGVLSAEISRTLSNCFKSVFPMERMWSRM